MKLLDYLITALTFIGAILLYLFLTKDQTNVKVEAIEDKIYQKNLDINLLKMHRKQHREAAADNEIGDSLDIQIDKLTKQRDTLTKKRFNLKKVFDKYETE